MSEPARKVPTYQDILDAPPDVTAEILNGELYLTPRPAFDHSTVASAAGADIHVTFGRKGGSRPGGWVILDEPELHLGRPDPRSEVAVPDLAGWRRARFERPDGVGHVVPPDWACEVLSPGARNIRRDRLVKADVYYRAGVAWYWIVDPNARTVEVFRHHAEGYVLDHTAGGDTVARIPPFTEAELDLAAWWAELEAEEAPDLPPVP